MRRLPVFLCFLVLCFSIVFSVKLEDAYNREVFKTSYIKVPNVPRPYVTFYKYTYSEHEYTINVCTTPNGENFYCYLRHKCSSNNADEDYCIPNRPGIRVKAFISGCFFGVYKDVQLNNIVKEDYEIVNPSNVLDIKDIKFPRNFEYPSLNDVQPPI